MSELSNIQDAEGVKVNTALRFYHEILGLDALHYGLWEGDPLTMEGLKVAQERYTDHLLTYIPEGVKSILDAGAGTGATSEKLKDRGFDVEALSPDPYQDYLFKKNRSVTFHLSGFQDFKPSKHYDLVLMSESCQYIPMDELFSNVKACASNGYLLINDYFITHPDNTAMSKSGHNMDTFMEKAKANGFELLQEEDITDKATPSLDLAKEWMDRYVAPSLELLAYSLGRKHPKLFGLVRWLLRKKINRYHDDMMLLDSAHFKRVKRYKILLFKVPA